MPFTLLDLIVLVVILISAVLAMVRGFTREVLSMVAWVAAALAGLSLCDRSSALVAAATSRQEIVAGIAVGAGVFLVTLILVSLITHAISDFVLDSPRRRRRPHARLRLRRWSRGLLLVVIAFLFYDLFVPAKAGRRGAARRSSCRSCSRSATSLSMLPAADPGAHPN